ncbi:hypothetical protein JSQ81_00005 [Sporosarcina sp. Marseille-Q4063]|uniref:hypothetical protein n=1 Tax=Sporosarcina sp. Marseille-Q4063 TaxID=2810514 RepID=UPI001BAF6AA4|nr:hypothetical protein [Sporosarcina sp. Marseille-Q4063]QUW22016.1 hypothetical protein JSQ81_00005 [Sporosarcina sp. Marseille-Q4063]
MSKSEKNKESRDKKEREREKESRDKKEKDKERKKEYTSKEEEEQQCFVQQDFPSFNVLQRCDGTTVTYFEDFTDNHNKALIQVFRPSRDLSQLILLLVRLNVFFRWKMFVAFHFDAQVDFQHRYVRDLYK